MKSLCLFLSILLSITFMSSCATATIAAKPLEVGESEVSISGQLPVVFGKYGAVGTGSQALTNLYLHYRYGISSACTLGVGVRPAGLLNLIAVIDIDLSLLLLKQWGAVPNLILTADVWSMNLRPVMAESGLIASWELSSSLLVFTGANVVFNFMKPFERHGDTVYYPPILAVPIGLTFSTGPVHWQLETQFTGAFNSFPFREIIVNPYLNVAFSF